MTRSSWIVAGVASALLVLGWSRWDRPELETAGTERLVNQLWISHMPKDPREMFGRLALIEADEGKIGVLGRGSNWRHFIELFGWRLEDGTLTAVFPQDRVRAKVKVRTWRCAGEAPAPFELCLEVQGRGDHKKQLFSRDEWRIRPHHVAEDLAAIEAEQPELTGLAVTEPVQAAPSELDEGDEADWPEAFARALP